MVEILLYALDAINNIPMIVYLLLLFFLGAGITVIVKKKGLKKGLRSSSVLLLIGWLFLMIGVAVIFRDTNAERTYRLIPLWSYFHIGENSYLEEVMAINLLNIMLFIPIGLLLGCWNSNITWLKVFFFGMGVSILIELLQFIFKKGLFEIDDVLHNVAGSMIGYGISNFISKKVCKTPQS